MEDEGTCSDCLHDDITIPTRVITWQRRTPGAKADAHEHYGTAQTWAAVAVQARYSARKLRSTCVTGLLRILFPCPLGVQNRLLRTYIFFSVLLFRVIQDTSSCSCLCQSLHEFSCACLVDCTVTHLGNVELHQSFLKRSVIGLRPARGRG